MFNNVQQRPKVLTWCVMLHDIVRWMFTNCHERASSYDTVVTMFVSVWQCYNNVRCCTIMMHRDRTMYNNDKQCVFLCYHVTKVFRSWTILLHCYILICNVALQCYNNDWTCTNEMLQCETMCDDVSHDVRLLCDDVAWSETLNNDALWMYNNARTMYVCVHQSVTRWDNLTTLLRCYVIVQSC